MDAMEEKKMPLDRVYNAGRPKWVEKNMIL